MHALFIQQNVPWRFPSRHQQLREQPRGGGARAAASRRSELATRLRMSRCRCGDGCCCWPFSRTSARRPSSAPWLVRERKRALEGKRGKLRAAALQTRALSGMGFRKRERGVFFSPSAFFPLQLVFTFFHRQEDNKIDFLPRFAVRFTFSSFHFRTASTVMLRPIAGRPSVAISAAAAPRGGASQRRAPLAIARSPLPFSSSSRRSRSLLQPCFAEPEKKPQTKAEKDKSIEQKEKLVKCE